MPASSIVEATTGLQAAPKEDYACVANNEPPTVGRPLVRRTELPPARCKQARLKGCVPLRRFLRGAVAAYRRFVHTGDPAHRFHCWATLQAISAGLDQLEHRKAGHEVAKSTPDGPDPGPLWAVDVTDRFH